MDFRVATESFLNQITTVCKNCNRDASEVILVAVSKTFPAETVNRYLKETADLFKEPPILGENKVQEVLNKKPHLREHRLHLIGHLQSNKVKQILPHIDYLHSLDSVKLADTLEKELEKSDSSLSVLIQANTTGEESKFGGGWEETSALTNHALTLPHLRVNGFMTLAPFTEDREVIRGCFRRLKEWRDRLQDETGVKLPELSMGMSHDYRIAIEEGATMIRIGSALFGDRH